MGDVAGDGGGARGGAGRRKSKAGKAKKGTGGGGGISRTTSANGVDPSEWAQRANPFVLRADVCNELSSVAGGGNSGVGGSSGGGSHELPSVHSQ